MTYQELLEQIKKIKQFLNLKNRRYVPLNTIISNNQLKAIQNNNQINQKVLKAFWQTSEELYTFNTILIAKHIYKNNCSPKKGIFKYYLHIPTKIMSQDNEDGLDWDSITAFNHAFGSIDGIDLSRSLINNKMNELTKDLMHYTTVGHNVNYPDLLATYIHDTKLKKVVKSIIYNKTIINVEDNYDLVFNVVSLIELNNELTHKLIEYMAGQMSDGLLEDGLILAKHIENPDYDEEEEYATSGDSYCDVTLWPEWIHPNSYSLYKKEK